MKNTLLIILMTFYISLTAQTKEELVKELVDITESNAMSGKLIDNAMKMTSTMLADKEVSEEQKVKINNYIDFVKVETKKLSDSLLKNDMVPIYSKYYSKNELKELVAFYKTPLGKKLLKTAPKVYSEINEVMMEKYLPAFRDKIMNKVKDLY